VPVNNVAVAIWYQYLETNPSIVKNAKEVSPDIEGNRLLNLAGLDVNSINNTLDTLSEIGAKVEEIDNNKTATFQSTPDDNKYPTEKLVKDNLDAKANKVSSPTNGNLIKTDADGHPVDTGIPADNIYKSRVIWAYQDFNAGVITGTSVTLSSTGYSDISFNASNIVNGAFIVRSDNLKKYVYTGATAIFSSKVKINSISGASVTLSGIPHSSNLVRIYFYYKTPFYPTDYTPPKAILSPSALDELDAIIVTQTEFDNATSVNVNGANQLVKLNASGELPAISAINLTNVPTGNQLSSALHCNDNAVQFRGTSSSPDTNHFVKYNSNNDGLEIKSNDTTKHSTYSLFTGSKSITYGSGTSFLNSSGNIGSASGTQNYSVACDNALTASLINVHSDKRIKKNITKTNTKDDLETISKLEVKNYNYIDYIKKGTVTQKKLIAQDLEKVFPQAVNTITNYIPNIYKVANVDQNKIFIEDSSLKQGVKLKMIVSKKNNEEIIFVTILKQKKEYIEVDTNINDLTENSKVFVYGVEVHDFKIVDYEAVSMLALSGLQELSKQIKLLKNEK
jgi:hypothetical protein